VKCTEVGSLYEPVFQGGTSIFLQIDVQKCASHHVSQNGIATAFEKRG